MPKAQADLLAPSPLPTADLAARLARVEHSDDVVDYSLRCVLAMAPGLSAEVLTAADRQVRDIFGRTSPYIATRQGEGRSARNEAIRRDHRAGERVALLSRRYQLSERTVWRIVTGDD